MHWLYTALLFFVFFGCVAMMIREGLWSNTLLLFDILFSGLIAFSFYGPLTIWLDEMLDGQYTYLLDFVMIWALFSISMSLLRLCTDSLSRTRMRFKKPVEAAGGPIVAVIAGWVMVGIVSASMYAAPLAKGFLGDAIVVKDESDVEWALMRPHIHWLTYAGGAMMRYGSDDAVNPVLDDLDKAIGNKEYNKYFSSDSSYTELWVRMFILRYQDRRAKLEKCDSLRVKRG